VKTSSAAPVGLDKLAFLVSLSDAVVSSDFKTSLRLPDVNSATGEAAQTWPLYTDSAGRVVSGVRAYLNLPDYQLTIAPDRRSFGSVAVLQFSAGCNSETNLQPLGCDAAFDAVSWVRSDLASRGFKLLRPLESLQLVRLDLASNVALNEPIANYAPLFVSAGASARQSKTDFGGTGFLVGNKKRDRWELALYDKGQEMKDKGYPLDFRPVNTLRPELRLLKSRLIRERLGLGESNLLAVRENWDALASAHSLALQQQLFRHRSEADRPCPFNHVALVVAAMSAARPFGALKADGYLCVLVRDLGLAAAKQLVHSLAVGDSETDKRQRARIVKELDAAALRVSLWESSPAGTPMMALYRELESKLLPRKSFR
jgi:hypothetical protein